MKSRGSAEKDSDVQKRCDLVLEFLSSWILRFFDRLTLQGSYAKMILSRLQLI